MGMDACSLIYNTFIVRNEGQEESPTMLEFDINQGFGLSLFSELRKAGAEVGTKQELLGDT